MRELKLGAPCVWGSLAAARDDATLEQLCDRIAPLFAERFRPEQAGLYVVSSNAGFGPALEFWSEALRVGLAVASPALFPSTLANAPCGALARRFQVLGPSHTFTGRAPALNAALQQLGDDLADARVSTGWIVALDFSTASRRRTLFTALRLNDAVIAADLAQASASAQTSMRCASALLRRLLARDSRR